MLKLCMHEPQKAGGGPNAMDLKGGRAAKGGNGGGERVARHNKNYTARHACRQLR